MSMDRKALDRAIAEAKRFIERAKCVELKWIESPHFAAGGYWRNDDTKASAACRRASMDLTRALADLRRPS